MKTIKALISKNSCVIYSNTFTVEDENADEKCEKVANALETLYSQYENQGYWLTIAEIDEDDHFKGWENGYQYTDRMF
jgi:hypothetical protein